MDPDPGGPKTCGAGGCGSGFGSAKLRTTVESEAVTIYLMLSAFSSASRIRSDGGGSEAAPSRLAS